jgi:hypothetical protein
MKEEIKNDKSNISSKHVGQKHGETSKENKINNQKDASKQQSSMQQGSKGQEKQESQIKQEIRKQVPPLKEGYKLMFRIPIVVSDLATFEKKFPNSQAEICRVVKQFFNVQVDKMIASFNHTDEFEIRLFYRPTGRN